MIENHFPTLRSVELTLLDHLVQEVHLTVLL